MSGVEAQGDDGAAIPLPVGVIEAGPDDQAQSDAPPISDDDSTACRPCEVWSDQLEVRRAYGMLSGASLVLGTLVEGMQRELQRDGEFSDALWTSQIAWVARCLGDEGDRLYAALHRRP